MNQIGEQEGADDRAEPIRRRHPFILFVEETKRDHPNDDDDHNDDGQRLEKNSWRKGQLTHVGFRFPFPRPALRDWQEVVDLLMRTRFVVNLLPVGHEGEAMTLR